MRKFAAAGMLVLAMACAPKAQPSGSHLEGKGRSADETAPRDFSGSEPAVDPASAICGEVRIKSELASRVNERSVLFVFAKPQLGGGAPAAVVRRDHPAFPAKFCLSQKNTMAPDMAFAGSQFVTARVEFDTSAGGQPGDLETVTKEPVSVGTADLVLTIDTVRP